MSEDAAVLLADFVSSLDNLPSEVHHILQEVTHKESKVSDLRTKANNRDSSIQRHARPVSQGGSGLGVVNPKEESSVEKIKNDLAKSEGITNEKVALTERGVNLLSRHLNRLSAQLELLTSQVPPLPTLPSFAPVEAPPRPAMHYGNGMPQMYQTPNGPVSYPGQGGQVYGVANPGAGYPNGMGQYYDRKPIPNSLPMQVPLLPAHLPQSPAHGAHPAYSYPQNTPISARQQQQQSAAGGAARPSRLSAVYPPGTPGLPNNINHLEAAQRQHIQQQQMRLLAQSQVQQQQQQMVQAQMHARDIAMREKDERDKAAGGGGNGAGGGGFGGVGAGMAGGQGREKRKRKDEEAEEEEEQQDEGDDGGDQDDTTPYCFCHRPSFGEMIGCDNATCAVEWFHLQCVGLQVVPKGRWICSDCAKAEAAHNNKKARR